MSEKTVEILSNGAFTTFGALIGIIGTLWVAKRTKESKRLAIISSPLGKLLGVDTIVKPRIKILYDGKPVEAVCMGEFAVRNTGTLSIQPVKIGFRPMTETTILGFQFSSASFVNYESRLKFVETGGGLDIEISFLNRGEQVAFVYFLTGQETLPIVDASQPGLDIQLQTQTLKRVPDIYAEIFLSTISQVWWLDKLMRLFKPYRNYVETMQKK